MIKAEDRITMAQARKEIKLLYTVFVNFHVQTKFKKKKKRPIIISKEATSDQQPLSFLRLLVLCSVSLLSDVLIFK